MGSTVVTARTNTILLEIPTPTYPSTAPITYTIVVSSGGKTVQSTVVNHDSDGTTEVRPKLTK